MRSEVDFVACAEKKGRPVRRQKNFARKQWPCASGARGADQSKSHSTHGAGFGRVVRVRPSVPVVATRVWRMGRRVAAARNALHAVMPSTVGLLPMARP